jgi:hypothetical protein
MGKRLKEQVREAADFLIRLLTVPAPPVELDPDGTPAALLPPPVQEGPHRLPHDNHDQQQTEQPDTDFQPPAVVPDEQDDE